MTTQARLEDAGLAILRIAGALLAWHGWMELFGGGVSFDAFADFSNGESVDGVRDMGFAAPVVFAWAGLLAALIGGLFVALGLYTRVAAGFAAVTMFVTAFLYHGGDDFAAKEKALLYLLAFVAIACAGAGRWSLDHTWRRRSS